MAVYPTVYDSSSDQLRLRKSSDGGKQTLGLPLTADEYLKKHMKLLKGYKIPVKQRSEFKKNQLPSSDLLKLIHYYASYKIGKALPPRRGKYSMLDETAVLLMGVMLEDFFEELVDGDLFRTYMQEEEINEQDTEQDRSLEDKQQKDNESSSDSSDDEN